MHPDNLPSYPLEPSGPSEPPLSPADRSATLLTSGRKVRARLVSVPRIYHQAPGQQPFQAEVPPYSRWLISEEQPYLRSFRVTETWTEIEFGWLERDQEWPGLLVVRNLEEQGSSTEEGLPLPLPGPKSLPGQTYPCLVALGVMDQKSQSPLPFTLIPPGEHSQLVPVYGQRYYARVPSGSGTARISIAALPQ